MTDLEEQIVARLDGLVEAVSALHAEVKRLADAATANHSDRTEQSGYLEEAEAAEPAEVYVLCQWPGCDIYVEPLNAEGSQQEFGKDLCSLHRAQLRRVRENKKQAQA